MSKETVGFGIINKTAAEKAKYEGFHHLKESKILLYSKGENNYYFS